MRHMRCSELTEHDDSPDVALGDKQDHEGAFALPKKGRWLAAVALATLLAPPMSARACQQMQRQVMDAQDGSMLILEEQACVHSGLVRHRVAFIPLGGERVVTVAEGISAIEEALPWRGELIDWNNDGWPDVRFVRAPEYRRWNYDHVIYRLDRAKLQLREVFRGVGEAEFKAGGYLIQTSHEGFRTQVLAAYPLHRSTGRAALWPDFTVETYQWDPAEPLTTRSTCNFESATWPRKLLRSIVTWARPKSRLSSCAAIGKKLGLMPRNEPDDNSRSTYIGDEQENRRWSLSLPLMKSDMTLFDRVDPRPNPNFSSEMSGLMRSLGLHHTGDPSWLP